MRRYIEEAAGFVPAGVFGFVELFKELFDPDL